MVVCVYNARLIWCSERKLGGSVSKENERTPEVQQKSTNPHQEDEKARQSRVLCRWFSVPNFYGGGAENGNFGHACIDGSLVEFI